MFALFQLAQTPCQIVLIMGGVHAPETMNRGQGRTVNSTATTVTVSRQSLPRSRQTLSYIVGDGVEIDMQFWTFGYDFFFYVAVHVSTNSGSSQQGGSNHGTSGSGSNVQSSSTNVVSSDPCRDIEKCNEYSDNVCTEYQPWARKNCARHCKFCER